MGVDRVVAVAVVLAERLEAVGGQLSAGQAGEVAEHFGAVAEHVVGIGVEDEHAAARGHPAGGFREAVAVVVEVEVPVEAVGRNPRAGQVYHEGVAAVLVAGALLRGGRALGLGGLVLAVFEMDAQVAVVEVEDGEPAAALGTADGQRDRAGLHVAADAVAVVWIVGVVEEDAAVLAAARAAGKRHAVVFDVAVAIFVPDEVGAVFVAVDVGVGARAADHIVGRPASSPQGVLAFAAWRTSRPAPP
ncbi:MAG: hypothetical protein R3E35_11465 [Rhodocyclaceae bacterium]